jgi:predicted CXXCH cytochrome family protein
MSTLAVLTLLILLEIFVAGCDEVERYEAMTFFFDGVEPPRPQGFEGEFFDPNSPESAQLPEKPLWYVHEARKDCTNCHDTQRQSRSPGQAYLIAPVPRLCYDCHDNFAISAQFVHGPVATGECLFCHHHHKSQIEHLLIETMPELCYRCHEITAIELAHAHLRRRLSTCTDCHHAHASSAKALVKEGWSQLIEDPNRARAVGTLVQDYVQRAKEQDENAFLGRTETTQTEGDSLFQVFLTVSKLIEQGQLQKAKAHLEEFKNNDALTYREREKIAEVLTLMDRAAAKAEQGPERVEQEPAAKPEKDNEQSSRQTKYIVDTYYRSMEWYREGKLVSARKGFVTVLKSGLIPPSMGETIRGYLLDIDNRLARGATQP